MKDALMADVQAFTGGSSTTTRRSLLWGFDTCYVQCLCYVLTCWVA